MPGYQDFQQFFSNCIEFGKFFLSYKKVTKKHDEDSQVIHDSQVNTDNANGNILVEKNDITKRIQCRCYFHCAALKKRPEEN